MMRIVPTLTRRFGASASPTGLYSLALTEPNKLVAEVHDRMPVILEREQFDTWMRTNDVNEAAALLKPAAEDVLIKRPVSKRVNSSKTEKDDPALIEEVSLAA